MKKKTSYIGRTTTTIKERMKQHTGIKFHHNTVHKRNVTGKQMIEKVTVLARSNSKTDLAILDALLIKKHNSVITKQVKDFSHTLKYFN